jgi:hypothetical protein
VIIGATVPPFEITYKERTRMLSACIQSIPLTLWLVALYVAMSAYSSVFKRIVWVPIALGIPLLFLGAQIPLVTGLSYGYQLLVAGVFGIGIALGTSFLRPHIIRVFTQKRFEIAGDVTSAVLLIAVVVIKLGAACQAVWFSGDIEVLNCVSAVIGTLVPAILLGRALTLLLYAV